MARPIVLSNGELHVGLNIYGLVHDFYFPYVGLENHAIGEGTRHRVGVWIDGKISWLDDGDWSFRFKYHHDALIGSTIATNEKMKVVLEFDDAVDSDRNVFMRNVHVVNHSDQPREIRLFMHQAFVIGDSRSNTDTVQYLPDSDAVVHYRGRRVFVISGTHHGEPFDQYSTGLFGIEGREGTWRDADDGELSMGTVEHGRVDSTMRFVLNIDGHSSDRVHYWIAAGTSLRDALSNHRNQQKDGMSARLHATAQWWHNWLEPVQRASEKLTREQRRLMSVSMMILKAHMDKRGAIIASTDSGMLNYGRDAYAYSWPRDGAYVLWPLIRLGYKEEVINYFDFCRRGLHPAGYLSHKYRADGALGSSWHTYLHPDGSVSPPIQFDETAGVLFMFAQFYVANPDEDLLREYYDSLVVPMAEFLVNSIDHATGLPKPSYDLWEEVFQTTTYTTAVCYGALQSAAGLAEVLHDDSRAVEWRSAADDIQVAAQTHLYDEDRGHFLKGLRPVGDRYEADTAIDSSSIYGSFVYGLFPIHDRRLESAIDKWLDRFNQAEYIGLPRYEGDMYRRVEGDRENYWIITTLWYAQYCLETGYTEMAHKILDWVADRCFESGVMSEQIIPSTLEPTSIAPLAWSHAEYVMTLLDMLSGDDYK